ncbi:MAG: isoleucine--tRNA ligase [Gemmatimonadetes bacterium]|nr:isoleucine--tRNA ligase [Gemmatimonadota bacterium]
MKRATYAPLSQPTPDALEKETLAEWKKERLFQRTLEANRSGKPFVFFEGPPTANGRPGIHHVFARTIKDLVCRYHTMLGESVTRIAGWDTHGLPVEIEVEKALGISGKPDIEKLGVAEFNRLCRESVFKYKADWESLSDRIAYWLDYEHPYVTYSNEYIESVWWLLKRLHERGRLFEGPKVLPYCIRCGTALSSHELALGYDTHRSPSIYVLLRLVDGGSAGEPALSAAKGRVEGSGGGDRYLLVWTTTPWTLPSNVAVAVNPDFRYVEIEVDGKRVIAEKSIAERKAIPGATHGKPLGAFPVIAEYDGRELIGWRYEQLLDAIPVQGKAFEVVEGAFVTSEEGTGLVHLAPAFGADDYATVQREGLAFFNYVDAAGRFAGTNWDDINGKTVFDANPLIAERLEKEGKTFGRYEPEGYEHTYPFCWRCDSPLIYYARMSWFVRTTDFKERMLEINRAVHWYPAEVGTGRFGEWLENNVDWALSRDRYWGTPLPIWKCDNDPSHREVIGSYADLTIQLERVNKQLPRKFDPHKPFIDEFTFPCTGPGCGGEMRRVPEVIDAWFDSGAMPFAQWHYPFAHEKEFESHFPADFICEGLDQTRGWFYSLLAIAAGVVDRPAYHHVIVNGLVLDAEGRKMSKRLGNLVDPWAMIERFGADAVRVYLIAASQVGLPKKFDPESIPEVASGFLTRLRNSYGFFALYAEDWKPGRAAQLEPVDQWLLSRLDATVAAVRSAWSNYDVTGGTRAIMDFCDNDLSNWYVRVNRARFWAPDASADPAALQTLHEALVTVCRLAAPVAPFLSDALHRRLTGTSVHLQRFPVDTGRRVQRLESAMDAVRKFASLARAAREAASLRVRQPLARMKVAMPQAVDRDLVAGFERLLKTEVNVKDIEIVGSDGDLVRLRGKANFRTLGKVYGKDTPSAAAAVVELFPEELRKLEAGEIVRRPRADGQTFEFRPEDVVIEREVLTDWLVQSEGPYVIALDPALNEELVGEGIAREVVNRIQRLRKEAGYEYTDRIEVSVTGSSGVLAAVLAHHAFIIGETLARSLDTARDLPEADIHESVDIDGLHAVISLVRRGDRPAAKSSRTATAGKKPAKKGAARKKSDVSEPGRKGK